MERWQWLTIALGAAALVYLLAVLALVLGGRRTDARALAGFIPDCLVLFRRLLGDPRVPRARKALLVAVVAYLVLPVDLVPDFIPVAGQLDDAIVVVLVLRSVLRAAGDALLHEHWPGPEATLRVLRRLALGAPRPA